MGRWEWVDFANVYPRASSSSRPAAPNSAYHAVIFGDDGRNVAQDSDSQARQQRRGKGIRHPIELDERSRELGKRKARAQAQLPGVRKVCRHAVQHGVQIHVDSHCGKFQFFQFVNVAGVAAFLTAWMLLVLSLPHNDCCDRCRESDFLSRWAGGGSRIGSACVEWLHRTCIERWCDPTIVAFLMAFTTIFHGQYWRFSD